MKIRDLKKVLRKLGCDEVNQEGSHLKIRCGDCSAILVIHGDEIAPGTLRNIRDHLAPCLGKDWLK